VGQEIEREAFTEADFALFRERLVRETERLGHWFEAGRFSRRAYTAGFELEAWLVGADARPRAMNEAFLKALDNDLVVPELSRFNVELNGSPTTLRGRAFSRLADELEHTWGRCTAVAGDLDARICAIGILPTIEAEALHLGNMSGLARYAALNARVLELREGLPFELRIDGRERLRRTHPDVMLEAAATSFQIHLQVRQTNAVRLYNAAQAVSGAVVAACANSPYLFGHDLWDETRIPLFEQAVAAGDRDWQRVAFGNGYVRESLFELFEQNRDHYPVLIPSLAEDGGGSLAHLRFHNGTIWRWNRPLIGFDHDGVPHLRIEHRVVPAGPTVADAIANAAFFYGMVSALAVRATPIEEALPFGAAKESFYAGARDGLDAALHWPGADGTVDARTLLLEELIPLAARGLAWLGIPDDEAEAHLGIVRDRVRSGVTGARWQRAWVDRHGRDLAGLVDAYLERQATNVPVHHWTL
jgi:gamma-glutamyl:cysteine ligase YbdK (ATP-grasp superfamily)